jgi:hypothetical protein
MLAVGLDNKWPPSAVAVILLGGFAPVLVAPVHDELHSDDLARR